MLIHSAFLSFRTYGLNDSAYLGYEMNELNESAMILSAFKNRL